MKKDERRKPGPKSLTAETVQEIRVLYDGGETTQQKLAERFGLSQSTICKIVNNMIHIEKPELQHGNQLRQQKVEEQLKALERERNYLKTTRRKIGIQGR